ncbi:hypothetical protein HPB50_017105 [Hyalomma asiaticum]|uniref:Uncharacterized protein n=1 Tax=Hyalomma asiaticum TaxID=266040 RepID=A0ACB7T531_HYAAI|nr:hypothetical protein HPB50_017105 [Hyalomma asiaticum]
MVPSDRAATAAASGRANALPHVPKDYRVVLPTLPSGEAMKSSVVLHYEISGRPFRIEHFRDPLKGTGRHSRDGVTLERIPHQMRLGSSTVLVVVPGRAPLCLRCRNTGHIRRDCRVPRHRAENAAVSSETPVASLQKSGDAGQEEEVETLQTPTATVMKEAACDPDAGDAAQCNATAQKPEEIQWTEVDGNAPKRRHGEQLGTMEERPQRTARAGVESGWTHEETRHEQAAFVVAVLRRTTTFIHGTVMTYMAWWTLIATTVALALFHPSGVATKVEDEPASLSSLCTNISDVMLVSLRESWNQEHVSFACLLGGPLTTWRTAIGDLRSYFRTSVTRGKRPIFVTTDPENPFKTLAEAAAVERFHLLDSGCPLVPTRKCTIILLPRGLCHSHVM